MSSEPAVRVDPYSVESDQQTGQVAVFDVRGGPAVPVPVMRLSHLVASRLAADLGSAAQQAARPPGWIAACVRCSHRRDQADVQREGRVCTSCLALPVLPEGQVRRSQAGTWVVATGNGRAWKVIGPDVDDPIGLRHGWRSDFDVASWAVLGSLGDLRDAL